MVGNVVKTQRGEHGVTASSGHEKVRVWMQVIVTLALLAAGIVILSSPNRVLPNVLDESTKRLAAGWVGAVIGYCLS